MRPALLLIITGIALAAPAKADQEQQVLPKQYALAATEIRSLAPGRGGAIASDRITVDGASVGYMYREEPRNEFDSGWAFLAGDETPEYLDQAANHGIYDVNTIANYDPDIVPFLDAPVGSAFLRTPQGFVEDELGAPQE